MIVKCTSEFVSNNYDAAKKKELQAWLELLPDDAVIYLGNAPEASWKEQRK
jgi:hypothetical protein